MIYEVMLIASLFLLIAFAVERIDRASGLPSVIVMLVLGMLAKPLLHSMGMVVEGLEAVAPVAGAVGLVLIVLEGALDIKLRSDRTKLAISAFGMAAAALVLCAAALAAVAVHALSLTYFQAAILATPFAVISSAIAIPSSHFLPDRAREFVIYESSVSDILGILVFFALVNSEASVRGFLSSLAGGGLLSLLLAIVCSAALLLVSIRIDAHVRFVPMLAGLFALYAAGKLLHLSPLIMVLLFGLLLNNLSSIRRFRRLTRWTGGASETTINEFKVLVRELTFAVRGFFFFLLGYLTNLADFAYLHAWLAAALVLAVVYGSRYGLLRLLDRQFATSLTWIAPRGLITILLYFEAKSVLPLPQYLDGTIILVVLLSTSLLVMSRRRQEGTVTPPGRADPARPRE